MTGAPSRRLRTNRARATCSSTWTSCMSIQRYPTPTSTCVDLHPCGFHHGTCGNSPPTPERRREHFRPFGFCRPPFQSRRRSRPPSASGPTRTRTTSSRSSVPPLLSRRTQPARGRADRTRRRRGTRTPCSLRRTAAAIARTAAPTARRTPGLPPEVCEPRPGQAQDHDGARIYGEARGPDCTPTLPVGPP
jgi:hypothetical protein